jgi:hypothetical protein
LGIFNWKITYDETRDYFVAGPTVITFTMKATRDIDWVELMFTRRLHLTPFLNSMGYLLEKEMDTCSNRLFEDIQLVEKHGLEAYKMLKRLGQNELD